MWAHNFAAITLKANAAITSTSAAPTAQADMALYKNLALDECKVVIQHGAFATVTTATFAIEECNTTNGTFTAPPYGTTTAVVTNTAAETLEWPVMLTKRYVRLDYTVDTTGSIPLSAVIFAVKRDANS